MFFVLRFPGYIDKPQLSESNPCQWRGFAAGWAFEAWRCDNHYWSFFQVRLANILDWVFSGYEGALYPAYYCWLTLVFSTVSVVGPFLLVMLTSHLYLDNFCGKVKPILTCRQNRSVCLHLLEGTIYWT